MIHILSITCKSTAETNEQQLFEKDRNLIYIAKHIKLPYDIRSVLL